MLQPMQLRASINFLFPKKFDSKYNKTENKDQQADTIDAMHVSHKITFWPVGIRFPEIEIF